MYLNGVYKKKLMICICCVVVGRTRNILDDFREAYYWLRQNTGDKARVMSWWDYGYQIAGMGNRTTLVDNNTWNNSHIALVRAAVALSVGFILSLSLSFSHSCDLVSAAACGRVDDAVSV